LKKLNILIADDESIIRLGLKVILEEAGHTVYAAENGASALKLAESCKPDMVILDIKMPEMDGLEAAHLLLNRMQVPVIFLTAYGEQELIERAARLPVMGYLVKPIKEAELLAMIEVSAQRFMEQARIAQTAAELEDEVSSRRIIDRAKGVLMQSEGISEFEAYQRLQQRTQIERRTLLEVAQELSQATQERAE
jgi:AmiR/NasT family two-component response regulator